MVGGCDGSVLWTLSLIETVGLKEGSLSYWEHGGLVMLVLSRVLLSDGGTVGPVSISISPGYLSWEILCWTLAILLCVVGDIE